MASLEPTGRTKWRALSRPGAASGVRDPFHGQNARVSPRQDRRPHDLPGFDALDALDVLAFAAELVLWIACGVAAHRLAGGGVAGLLAAVPTVVVVIIGWSLVMAPRAPRRIAVTERNLVVLVLGGVATALLAWCGASMWTGAAALSALALVVADRTRRTTRALG